MRPPSDIWLLAVAVVSSVVTRGYWPVAGPVPVAAQAIVVPQPVPVALSVPAAPVPVSAAGRIALVYELHVANVGTRPLRIDRIEVRDADYADARPVATYARAEVERNVKLIGPRVAPPPKTLGPNVRAVVYLWLGFDSSAAVPKALTHHVAFADGDSADGARVSVRAPADLTLASPVGVGDWWIGLGPSNTSEHRRAVIRVGEDTVPHLAQRFAIDWVKVDAGGEYARDHRGRRNTDWYGYGEPALAVADARVAEVADGIPDNTPGEGSRAVPMRVATVLGNYVLLDLGQASDAPRRYALYGHLEPGTLRVRVGDVVNRGQALGAIGNSGNSDGPHLHFHVTEAADAAAAALRGEGVPFVLEAFTVVAHDPSAWRSTPRSRHSGPIAPHCRSRVTSSASARCGRSSGNEARSEPSSGRRPPRPPSASARHGVSQTSLFLIGDLPGFTPQIARLVSMMNYARSVTSRQ